MGLILFTMGSTNFPISYSCIVATGKCLNISSQIIGTVFGDFILTYVATCLTCDKNKSSLALDLHLKHSPI